MPSGGALQHIAGTRPGFAPCPWRGTWLQLTLQTTFLVLLLTTRYGAARPPIMDYVTADEVSHRSAVATRSEGMSLRSLCDRTQSVEMRVLCRLTQQRSGGWLDGEGRKKPISKRSDGSSLSAFQRFVSELKTAAEQRSDAMRELQQLRAMGVIDENNQVVRVPSETRNLMERLG
ncbi:uncharacterized protein [Asterias amurensis]|uniref:uncharacterized protein n=1 Tax=Asterias amurensis TaxID=7602 RepID=UPI003AB4CCDB